MVLINLDTRHVVKNQAGRRNKANKVSEIGTNTSYSVL